MWAGCRNPTCFVGAVVVVLAGVCLCVCFKNISVQQLSAVSAGAADWPHQFRD